jgi:hypothetical protein
MVLVDPRDMVGKMESVFVESRSLDGFDGALVVFKCRGAHRGYQH